jgi:hypothetical protein
LKQNPPRFSVTAGKNKNSGFPGGLTTRLAATALFTFAALFGLGFIFHFHCLWPFFDPGE